MSATLTKNPSDRTKNMVGPKIRKLRSARGLSQSKLAMRLQLDGLDVSRARRFRAAESRRTCTQC